MSRSERTARARAARDLNIRIFSSTTGWFQEGVLCHTRELQTPAPFHFGGIWEHLNNRSSNPIEFDAAARGQAHLSALEGPKNEPVPDL